MKKFLRSFFIFLICLVTLFSTGNFSYTTQAEDTDNPYTITLGDAIYDNDNKTTFTFPNATVDFSDGSSDPTIFTATVTSGSVALGTTDLGDARTITDKSNKSITLIWNSNSNNKEKIKNIIRTLQFTYVSDMKITISINGKDTNVNTLLYTGDQDYTTDSSKITLTQWSENGHYYLYVPYYTSTKKITWRNAYNNALDFKLGGMTGYLVTLTEKGEQEYLNNLADANVWTGATVLGTEETLYTGSGDNTAVKKLSGEKIPTGTLLYYVGTPLADADSNYNNLGFVRAAQAYASIVGKKNNTSSPLIKYYYWSAGPEAGDTVQVTNDSGETIITLYNNPNMRRELNGGSTGDGSNYKWDDMDGYHKWQHESCTAAYVGTVAGYTGFNDIIEGNFKNFDAAAAKGYVVEFGGWTEKDDTDSDSNKKESIVNFEFDTESYPDSEPKSTEVTIDGDIKTETYPDGTLKITVTGVNTTDSYAVLDKDGNAVTDNVYDIETDDETKKKTANNGWFTRDVDGDSSTLIWRKLPIENGPYKVIKTSTTSPTTNPSTETEGNETIASIRTATFKGTNATWYKDEACTNVATIDSRNSTDTSDSGERTYYIKADSGYVYSSTPTIITTNTTTTVTTTDTPGVYKVTFTIPTDNSVVLEVSTPSKESFTVEANNVETTYDGNAHSISVKVTTNVSNYSITYYSDKDGKNAYSSNPSFTDVGQYTVYYKVSSSSSSTQIYSNTVTINQKPITMSGLSVSDKEYNALINATITSTTYTLDGIVNSDDVSVDSSKATATFIDKNVGSSKIVTGSGFTLKGSKASNYILSNQPTTTATITQKEITVVGLSVNNKEYDGTTTATISDDVYALSGVLESDKTKVSLDSTSATAKFENKNAGDNKTVTISGFTLVGSEIGNYKLTQPTAKASITKKEVIIDNVEATSKTYDGTTSAVLKTTYSLSGAITNDDVSISATNTTATFDSASVGKDKIVTVTGFSLSGNDAQNYTIKQPVTGKGDIVKQVVSADDVTVTFTDSTNKTYDGKAVSVASVSHNNKTLAKDTDYTTSYYQINSDGTETELDVTSLKDAGYYKVVIHVNTDTYTATVVKTITISKKDITVNLAAQTREYSAEETSATFKENDLNNISTNVNNEKFNISNLSGSYDNNDVGNNKPITLSPADIWGTITYTDSNNTGFNAANYNITLSATGTITNATLSNDFVSVTNYNSTYDGTGHNITVTKPEGDDSTIAFYKDQNCTQEYTSDIFYSNVGTYTVYYKVTKQNYNPLTGSGTITITKKPVTINGLVVFDKQYDGNTNATYSIDNATIEGKIATDELTIDTTNASVAFSSADKGTHTINVSGFALSGSAKDNYELSSQPSATASITDLSIELNDKTYDGTALSITDVKNGTTSISDYTVTWKTSDGNELSEAPKDAGSYEVTVSANATSTSEAITSTKTVIIYPKKLTVTGLAVNDKDYDTTTTATLKDGYSISEGIISGDEVSLSVGDNPANFKDKNAGKDKLVEITGLSLTGTSASNYTIDSVYTTTASINKIPVKIGRLLDYGDGVTGIDGGLSVDDKEYDDTTTATINSTTYLLSALNSKLSDEKIDSDDVYVDASNATAQFEDAQVGDDKNVTSSGFTLIGTDAINYELSEQPTATACIKNANVANDISVELSSESKIYDGLPATLTVKYKDKVLTADTTEETTDEDGNVVEALKENDYSCSWSIARAGTDDNDHNLAVNDSTYQPQDAAYYTVTVNVHLANSNEVEIKKNVVIFKRVLGLNGVKFNDKVYDGDENDTVDFSNAELTNTISTNIETVSINTENVQATFENSNEEANDAADVGDNKSVTLSGVYVNGEKVGSSEGDGFSPDNYVIYDIHGTASITPYTPTISSITLNGNGTLNTEENTYSKEYDGSSLTAEVNTITYQNDTLNPGEATYTYTWLDEDGNELTTVPKEVGKYQLKVTATYTNTNYASTSTIVDYKIVDTTAPTGKITVSTDSWSTFLNEITFGKFFNKTQKVTITGSDTGSHTVSISYYLAEEGSILTVDQLSAMPEFAWSEYTNDFNINPDEKYVIYAKISDESDNTTYISSNGLVLHDVAPVFNGVENNKTYANSVSFTLEEDYLDTFTINGKSPSEVASVTADESSGVTTYTISATSNVSTYTLYAKDKAGNETTLIFKIKGALNTDNTTISITNKTYDGTPITVSSITHDNASLNTSEFTYTYYKVTTNADGTTTEVKLDEAPSNAGSYKVVASIDNDSYVGSTFSNFTIDKKEVTLSNIKALDKQKDGNTNATLKYDDMTIEGLVAGDDLSVNTDSVSANFTNAETIGEEQTVTCSGFVLSGSDADNYKLPDNYQYTTQAKITDPSIQAYDKEYDGQTISATVTEYDANETNGYKTLDSNEYTIQWKDSSDNVISAPSAVGTYTVTATIKKANTEESTISKTITISPKKLTVSGFALSKVYDSTTSGTVDYKDATLTGAINNEDVSLDQSATVTATYRDKDVGTNKAFTITGLSLTGENASNYTIDSSYSSKNGIIQARKVPINLTVKNKVYDGTKDAEIDSYTLKDAVSNDNVSINATNAKAEFNDASVGTNKDVTASGFTLVGQDASNYQLTAQPTTTANITSKSVNDEIRVEVENKVYDGKTIDLKVYDSNNNLLENGKDYSLTWSEPFTFGTTHNVENPTNANTYTATIQLTDTVNYSGSYTQQVTITQRPVTISGINVKDKLYDGNTDAEFDITNAYISNVVEGESLTVDGSVASASFEDENVGVNKQVNLNGFGVISGDDTTNASNYTLDTQPTATANIIKDEVAPEGTIEVADDKWNSFLNTITFSHFFKQTQSVTITAEDNSDADVSIYYYLSNKAITKEEVQSITNWKTYTSSFNIAPNNKYVIYAKLVDVSGNTTYISSDGLVLHNKAPKITGIKDNSTYEGDTTFTVEEEYLASVTINGKVIELDEGNRYTLSPSTTPYVIVVEDEAGNTTTITVTINEKVEEPTSPSETSSPDDSKDSTQQKTTNTSDTSNPILWCSLLSISIICMLILMIKLSKQSKC